MEALKAISGIILGIIILIGIIVSGIFFLTFGTEIAFRIAPFIYWLSGIVLFIDIFALLASITHPARSVSGAIIYISSYVFGLATWIYGLAVTLTLWGFLAVIIGILLGGIGVVPIGMLAAVFHGEWGTFTTLLIMIVLTYATRLIGMLIAQSGSNHNVYESSVIDVKSEQDVRTWKDIE